MAVIVAAQNAARTIRASLEAILGQSYAKLRVMVIDDASGDQTSEIVRALGNPRVCLMQLDQSHGPAEARNRALAMRAEQFMWIVDSDCVPNHDCLELLMDTMAADDAIGIAGGANPQDWGKVTYAAAVFDLSNRHLVAPSRPAADVPYVVGANMLVRRAVFERVGLYDAGLRIAEDFDLCVRARQAGFRVVFQPRAISEHRHPRTTIRTYLQYQYKIGYYGCRFRLKHRAAVPFGRHYPSTPRAALVMAPVYLGASLARMALKNLSQGAGWRFLRALPLIILGQLWNVTGVVRGLGRLRREQRALTRTDGS